MEYEVIDFLESIEGSDKPDAVLLGLLNSIAHNLTQQAALNRLMLKAFPRMQNLLLDAFTTKDMSAP